jgi:hypothetical protein
LVYALILCHFFYTGSAKHEGIKVRFSGMAQKRMGVCRRAALIYLI